VDPDEPLVLRTFVTCFSGADVPEGTAYVGTIIGHVLVWHLFERVTSVAVDYLPDYEDERHP
jgi:hypothetical protein